MEEGTKVINELKCTMCSRFCSHILYKRNFSDKWILDADSIHTSNIHDHAISEQYTHAMDLLKKKTISAAQSLVSNAPIVVLNNLSGKEKTRLRHKFDIASFLAVEKISFCKFLQICELESRHSVSIGKITLQNLLLVPSHIILQKQRGVN